MVLMLATSVNTGRFLEYTYVRLEWHRSLKCLHSSPIIEDVTLTRHSCTASNGTQAEEAMAPTTLFYRRSTSTASRPSCRTPGMHDITSLIVPYAHGPVNTVDKREVPFTQPGSHLSLHIYYIHSYLHFLLQSHGPIIAKTAAAAIEYNWKQ